MKKILLIMFCMFLLIGMVSAAKIKYEKDDMEVNFKKSFLGISTSNLGSIELKSHRYVTEIRQVGYGDYQPAMYYDFSDWELYENGLGNVYFTDMKTGEDIEKLWYFAEWKEQTRQIPIYGSIGEWNLDAEIIGYESESYWSWVEYNSRDIPNTETETIRIALMVYMEKDEKLDAIWTIAGNQITKHAGFAGNLNKNLISYWKFDEPSGEAEDFIGTNNGTNNDIGFGITGIINDAYNFTGDSYSNITYPDFTGAIDLSISMWIKANGEPNAHLFSDWGSGGNNYIFQTANPGFVVRILNGDGAAGQDSTIDSTARISQNEWTHVVMTRDLTTNNMSLYINGILNNSGSISLNGGITTNEIYIGRGVNEFNFTGGIDEVGFWDRSLTPLEVTDLYNGGSGLPLRTDIPILNSPIDYFNTTDGTINFDATVIDSETDLNNVTLFINDIGIEINTSGIQGEYIFTESFDIQTSVWLIQSCNLNECINSTSRTFTHNRTFLEDIWYNTTSFETAEEVFTVNVSANSSLTAVTLDYNGTDYSMTQSGTNWTRTLDIPEEVINRTFKFEYTYEGDTINSDQFYQNISLINFSICDASLTTKFLNLSFKDEQDLSVINASITTSTFDYYLGGGTVNKTFSFINITDSYNYEFCATPNLTLNVDSFIQYKQGTAYPQRVFDASIIQYTNQTTNSTLYLLGVADGIFVTFQTINTANLVLSGVAVTATREIGGEDITVGQGTTGADGGVTLWLNPDFIHDFTFVKQGFPTLQDSFAPTQSAYTITLGGTTTPTDSFFKGINFNVIPTDASLINDTTYTFGFTLTSTFWDLEEYGFNLRLENGTIITGDTTSTSGTALTKSYDTNNQTKIHLDYFWLVNSTYTNGTRLWIVYNTEDTQWSISTFFTDLKIYLDSGFFGIDDFGRYLIIFVIIFFTVGIMSFKFGFTSPMTISVMTFLIVFFFDVVVGIIPSLSLFSGTEVPYLLTFLTGLIATIAVLREATRV